jgi:hypothetical protein
MNSFTAEQKQFYGRVKRVGRNTLDQFFGKKQLTKPKQTEAKTKLGRMIPIFDYLKDNGLLEEFMQYEYVKQ